MDEVGLSLHVRLELGDNGLLYELSDTEDGDSHLKMAVEGAASWVRLYVLAACDGELFTQRRALVDKVPALGVGVEMTALFTAESVT